jgi:rhodanese-related sulfurtransferase
MNKILALLAPLAASLSFSACSKPPYENVDYAQLQVLITQGVPVYDVRRPEEWKQTGVVEGSRLLTWVDKGGRVQPGFFEMLAADAPKDKPLVIICRTGNRTSQLAREMMEKHGYTKVYNVKDGISGWLASGQPVVRN